MSGLDIFAWVVLIILILTAIVGFVILAMLPGKIAKQREHPQADAISIAGWVGAITFGIFWPLALIWAFTKSPLQTITNSATESETGARSEGAS